MSIRLQLKLLAIAWSIGLFGRLIVFAFQAAGLVRVEGTQHLRKLLSQNQGFLVIHRHPSMRETVIIPLLLFPYFLWNPLRLPVVTPDKRNYYDPWWCAPFRPTAIPVPRGNGNGEFQALSRMYRALKEGRPLVIAPEGGRTFKGKEFKYLLPCGRIRVSERPEGGVDLSAAVIRRFQPGVRVLCANETPILPVWVDSSRWRTFIVFGEPKTIPKGAGGEVEMLEDLLLRTSTR